MVFFLWDVGNDFKVIYAFFSNSALILNRGFGKVSGTLMRICRMFSLIHSL
jgi:hypothetical protein